MTKQALSNWLVDQEPSLEKVILEAAQLFVADGLSQLRI